MDGGWPGWFVDISITEVAFTDVAFTDVVITDVLVTNVAITDVAFTEDAFTDVTITEVVFTDVLITSVLITKVMESWAPRLVSLNAGSSSIHRSFEWVNFLAVCTWQCRRREVLTGEGSGRWRFMSGAPG